ncbi:glycosyltransferase family 4 protein [Desertifilum sp. FACHB-1129]|uniref:Group 1 glycosyl transferase n=1 Tax=Desertifilum tharense IPPAS B-1220 TaxID=1781255 RepID=A0A1E5QNM5_9CYAN|nr:MULTISPECIES: glycosyltransferase family 4 protein [Desertifilum]MDA0212189.1 glycosyltransferase family 4 protein [Cyanobacteria bacterium FC1]MBD2312768.1 glycosyltransferase family 4 protein [Desertifilum sp. FACHB-1129]MBD2324132.1 glycosyltransferase family 4 protein [Desertifilum sp. FACHB-866]MBD2334146.1 glycosyltransferase family 4 protein [Desertifilum sp. FACHB-868]OEJ76214.1 group 1 glycosyl transferase [Desertifilum tharense IPPAS B-1220]
MRLAYLTTYDIFNRNTWSKNNTGLNSTGYYLANHLKQQSVDIDYIGPLEKKTSIVTRLKWSFYRKLKQKDYYRWAEPLILKDYAKKASKKIAQFDSDIIFCPENAVPIAYLESDKPIVLYTDSTLAGLIGFYPWLDNICEETKKNIYHLEKLALERCQLVVFPSDWAAQTAINVYQISPKKIKIVPWGATVECDRTFEDIDKMIQNRPNLPCKLLFLGVDWVRKGGDIALQVAKQLNQSGLATELTIVGCHPPASSNLPDFVNCLGFLKRNTELEKQQFNQLLANTHFLILPSRAEAYGLVFCEANSFATPCLATNVGGIPGVIRDDYNGKTFSLDASVSDYCQYIANLMSNYEEYQQLAFKSYAEYQSRLNWTVTSQKIQELLEGLLD